jgi:hypothetical protein
LRREHLLKRELVSERGCERHRDAGTLRRNDHDARSFDKRPHHAIRDALRDENIGP